MCTLTAFGKIEEVNQPLRIFKEKWANLSSGQTTTDQRPARKRGLYPF